MWLLHIPPMGNQFQSVEGDVKVHMDVPGLFNLYMVVKPPPPRDYIASRSSPKIQIHVPEKYLVRDLALTSVPSGHSTSEQRVEDDQTTTTVEEILPFFEEPYNMTNVTTQLGQNVYLHCRVNDLRDKTVSWVKRKGESLHLITAGHMTYSNEARYSLDYQPPNDWRLLIRYANERDDGLYECQVSSYPPLVFYVYLSVVVPRVEIVDNRGVLIHDKFYKQGSTIELICVISRVPQPSGYVQWKHGIRTLNYDTTRGGISVKSEMKPEGAHSKLYIANANKHDSGNYTCSLDEAAMTTVFVHVLNGEHADAMQYGGCDTRNAMTYKLVSLIALLTLFVIAR
ncbi:zwei Ig domain protein zig-8-like [Arctopsyche grandis]|uniref:zwei Ig domain protein zig-8-like n=1 Tax=Arctopsyche grandis TaxID=121162 RepID=UPI00406D686B